MYSIYTTAGWTPAKNAIAFTPRPGVILFTYEIEPNRFAAAESATGLAVQRTEEGVIPTHVTRASAGGAAVESILYAGGWEAFEASRARILSERAGIAPRGQRTPLPARHRTERTKARMKTGQQTAGAFIDVAYNDHGQPMEIFIDTAKAGSEMRDMMSAFGVALSVGLQHGVPAEAYANGLRGFAEKSMPDLTVKALRGTLEPEE